MMAFGAFGSQTREFCIPAFIVLLFSPFGFMFIYFQFSFPFITMINSGDIQEEGCTYLCLLLSIINSLAVILFWMENYGIMLISPTHLFFYLLSILFYCIIIHLLFLSSFSCRGGRSMHSDTFKIFGFVEDVVWIFLR